MHTALQVPDSSCGLDIVKAETDGEGALTMSRKDWPLVDES